MKRFGVALIFMCGLSAHSAELTVRTQNVPADSVLVFQVYDSPSAFGDFRNPVTEQREQSRADNVYTIADVPSGDVAMLVYVDQNRNGIIDKNFIGIPKEPLGLSNGYRPKGPPSFERAKFFVDDRASNNIDIEIHQLLGDRGRTGVGIGIIGRSSPYVDSNSNVVKVIPAISYIGERLQWLGPNVQYSFIGTGRWSGAAIASYRVGVYEQNDSPALDGLGDREGALMVGLGLRAELPVGVNLSLKYEHDVLDKIGGGAASAKLAKSFQVGPLRMAPQLQINWLSEDLTNYDFGVPLSAATPSRPAYSIGSSTSVEAGFGGFIEVTQNWLFALNFSAEFLPSKVQDSPIVGDDRVIKAFAAFTYVF